jgi:hypothetical protein
MKKPKTEREFMTVRQFAAEKGVEPRTVARWLKLGLIPDAELDEVAPGVRLWKIPPAAVDTFVMPKAGRRKSTKKAAKK